MFIIYYVYLKNPPFSVKIIYKKEKTLQQMPKGWKWSGSPRRSIGRTFRIVFKFANLKKIKNSNK